MYRDRPAFEVHAKALGLTVSNKVQLLADKVIE
jgi:hypothetical protein